MHTERAQPAYIAGILAIGYLSPCLAVPNDPLVLVERVVDVRYGLTDKANADLETGLRSPLRHVYKVKPGDSLRGIASTVYGINPTKDHSTYAKLEDTIGTVNALPDPNHIAAGQSLVVPALPRKQSQRAPAAVSATQPPVPKIEVGPDRADVLSGTAYDYSVDAVRTPGSVADLGDPNSPFVRQTQWVPASVAHQDSSVTVLAQPISVRFHQAPGGAADDVSQDIAGLRAFVNAHPAVHESVVYVLDDSWPDAQAFSESVEFFKQADAKIRQTLHFGAVPWPASLTAPQATTTFPWAANGGTSHALAIETALAPFRAVSNSVRVVYVPLFTEQTGAKDLLGEIVLLYFIGHYKQGNLENSLSPQALQVLTAKATSLRDQILNSLPAHMSATPAETDQAVVTGLLYFAQWYAQVTGEPFFLNTSWVVQQYEFDFGPPPNLLGATFAAAGDNPSMDIFATNVLLASHASAFPGDVIAIMNNHPDGSRGNCTSFWTPNGQDPVYGLTYNGFLANSMCGTSFSAPRVAWTLALRETRHPLVTDKRSQTGWFQSFRAFILSLQDQSRPADLRYWFSPPAAVQK